jgi:hypothetical protein
MVRKVRILLGFSIGEILLLPILVLFAWLVRISLSLSSLPRVVGVIRSLHRVCPPGGRRDLTKTLQLADFVAYATQGFGRCLARSLLLFLLLPAGGCHVDFIIGVNKVGDKFESHAWIELQGQALENNQGIAGRFSTLIRFTSA